VNADEVVLQKYPSLATAVKPEVLTVVTKVSLANPAANLQHQ
jgi:hypothetical protein